MKRMTEALRSLANQTSMLASSLNYHHTFLLLLLSVMSAGLVLAQVCLTPPSGMVSWWPGDGNANDIVGGNNGALQDGATFAPGLVGPAFSFNVSTVPGAYVDVPNAPNLNPGTSDFTVDFWMNSTSAPSLAEYLWTKRDGCTFTSFLSMQMQATGPGSASVTTEVADFPNGIYNPILGTAVVNDGQWHHIGLVR